VADGPAWAANGGTIPDQTIQDGDLPALYAQDTGRRTMNGATNQTNEWTPIYAPWRHGGWYVTNIHHARGGIGCVSRNFPDRKWRIVCDARDGEHTYRTRDEAARAEMEIAVRNGGRAA
jgi:hypothetical protein